MGWASNRGINTRAGAAKHLPLCWQVDEEPRARLQRTKAWWVIWVGPAHKELWANPYSPRESGLELTDSRTPGWHLTKGTPYLAGTEGHAKLPLTCVQSARAVTSTHLCSLGLHLCTHTSSSKQDGCGQHFPVLAQAEQSGYKLSFFAFSNLIHLFKVQSKYYHLP